MMTPFPRMLTLFFLSLFIATWHSEPADACSEEAVSGLSTPVALPVDRSSAPRNTKVWIPTRVESFFDEPRPMAEDLSLTSGGSAIAVTTTAIAVDGDLEGATLWVLEPVELLPEGATIEVWISDQQVSSFEVHSGVDQEAPHRPELEELAVSGEYFGQLFCGERSQAKVTVAEHETLLVMTDRTSSDPFPQSALAVGSGISATAYNLAPGDTELQVFAVDLAGNQSPPLLLPTVRVPPSVTGCTVATTRHRLPLWFLAIAILTLRWRPSRGAS